jgi:hypothetical protein
MSAAVDSLEKRVAALERRILGAAGQKDNGSFTSATSATTTSSSAASALVALAKEVGNAVEARGDRVAPILRRANDIDHYLNPSMLAQVQSSALSADAKADLALSQASLLRQVDQHGRRARAAAATVLDEPAAAERLEAAAALEKRLAAVGAAAAAAAREEAQLAEDVARLAAAYNATVDELTAAFLRYDACLKRAEEAANV